MRERLMGVVAVAVIILGVWYVGHPQGFVPIFDADLQRLAMTAHESHCAGQQFLTRGGGDIEECRESSGLSTDVNLDIVQPQFCAVVAPALRMEIQDCMNILTGQQLWPTYDGDLTSNWSQSNPYPGSILGTDTDAEDSSRTGGRDGLQRGEG